jgi:hypothetical protein
MLSLLRLRKKVWLAGSKFTDQRKNVDLLDAVEDACLRPSEKLFPLITAQGDGRVVWIRRATQNDSITSCRDLDT